MAQEQQKMHGLSLQDVIGYVSDKNPAQMKAEVDDFISDLKNICTAIDTLYDEKIIPLAIRGFFVSIKVIDQENNEEYFIHETGKSASGKSLMQYIRETV